jgi:hypothetical protein
MAIFFFNYCNLSGGDKFAVSITSSAPALMKPSGLP